MSPAARDQIRHGIEFVERNYPIDQVAVRAFVEQRCLEAHDALTNASTEFGLRYAIALAKATLKTAARLSELDLDGKTSATAHQPELAAAVAAIRGRAA